jgi:hypothetical protein
MKNTSHPVMLFTNLYLLIEAVFLAMPNLGILPTRDLEQIVKVVCADVKLSYFCRPN